MNRPDPNKLNKWHSALNRYVEDKGLHRDSFPHIMYEAKRLSDEVPRMAMLFKMEREGKLPKIHRQCSHSLPEKVEDNHLTCCLGVECRACPMLLALEKAELIEDDIDLAKAWTCGTHILAEGNRLDTSEGYILTTDDRMYWDNVYDSLASVDYDD